ncbi:probable cytochrome P450 6a14 [Diabrotica undecimpunctata]|uniref:probable cytochrome P450 6a14 n=1 Tax=Diabrotica undecimpunctata TaxID=50387 RepID=UPI003B637DED
MMYYILALVAVIYLYLKWHFSFWTRKGVYQMEPSFIFGNVSDLLLNKRSIAKFLDNMYAEFKSKGLKYGGYYEMFKPRFVPVDLDLIKHILQKDFSYFVNRGIYCDPGDPLSMNIFNLRNEKWKKLRAKLGPTLSIGRLKTMFPITKACSDQLRIHLKELSLSKGYVNIHEVGARFTTENFGSIAFGIEFNHLKESNLKVLKICIKNIAGTFATQIKRLICCNFPEHILRRTGYKTHSRELTSCFMDLVTGVTDYREKNNIQKKDFMDVLLQLKNKGNITDDGDSTPVTQNGDQDELFLSVPEVVAQCFAFFIAGFETSSTTIEFALFELATHPDIQAKVIQEVKSMLEKNDNEINFEGLKSLTYTEQVINETLRLHPPLPGLLRICNKDYKVPNSDLVIEEGTMLGILVSSIHRDPEIYPDPDVFDPDRFTEENIATRHPMAFMPFGEGPRICIGARFGMTVVKIALATILQDFSVTVNKKTQLPLEYSKKSISTRPQDTIWLNLHPLG